MRDITTALVLTLAVLVTAVTLLPADAAGTGAANTPDDRDDQYAPVVTHTSTPTAAANDSTATATPDDFTTITTVRGSTTAAVNGSTSIETGSTATATATPEPTSTVEPEREDESGGGTGGRSGGGTGGSQSGAQPATDSPTPVPTAVPTESPTPTRSPTASSTRTAARDQPTTAARTTQTGTGSARVVDLAVNRTTVPEGRPVTITATVVNSGADPATYEATLHLFGEAIEAREVRVPVEDARQVEFSVTIEATGEYTARVGNESQRIVVTAGETTRTPQSTDGFGAGFGPTAAVTALLALGALARRRSGPR